MITEQTFYQAVCEAKRCAETLPDEESHEVSHWPLSYLKDELRTPREAGHGDVEVMWFYDGEHTFCPKHHPDARPCGTCDGQGAVRIPGTPPRSGKAASGTCPTTGTNAPSVTWSDITRLPNRVTCSPIGRQNAPATITVSRAAFLTRLGPSCVLGFRLGQHV